MARIAKHKLLDIEVRSAEDVLEHLTTATYANALKVFKQALERIGPNDTFHITGMDEIQ